MLQTTYTKKLHEELIEGSLIYKATIGTYSNGACQCYNNCDCIKNKDKLLFTSYKYFHKLKPYNGSLANQFGYKLFDTYMQALQSYNTYYEKF